MTVKFVILDDFFEIDMDQKEEDLQEFVRYVLLDLHPELKGLIFVSIQLI